MTARWTSRASIPGHLIDCTQHGEHDGQVLIEVECSCGFVWSSRDDAASVITRFADALDQHLRDVGEQ